MTEQGVSRLAAAWSKAEEAHVRGKVSPQEWQVIFAVQRLGDARPAELWRFVRDVLALSPGPEVCEILAAGPLEDLVRNFGELMLPEVEAEVLVNAEFARLLRGVWIPPPQDVVAKRYAELGCVVVAAA
jgi:hypothetical protein